MGSSTSAEGFDSPNESRRCGSKPFDGEVLVLELWGMWSTPSLPLLQVSLSPAEVAAVRVPSIGEMELFNQMINITNCVKQMINIKLDRNTR